MLKGWMTNIAPAEIQHRRGVVLLEHRPRARPQQQWVRLEIDFDRPPTR